MLALVLNDLQNIKVVRHFLRTPKLKPKIVHDGFPAQQKSKNHLQKVRLRYFNSVLKVLLNSMQPGRFLSLCKLAIGTLH